MLRQAGQIIWHELLTADTQEALSFYPAVTGWSVEEMTTQVDGTVFRDETLNPVASIAATERRGGGEGWVAYVMVDDLDAALSLAEGFGAAVVQGPGTGTGLGRSAILLDTQGAAIGLVAPDRSEGREGRDELTSGGFGWHELYAEDVEKAFAFYATMFGWERGQTFDMGSAGPYVTVSGAGVPIGGMMRRPAIVPRCLWSPFVQIADIGEAEARVAAAGGAIVDGLRPTPGGNWTVKCTDRRGAAFAMSGRRDG